jgi:hypothetical protein
MSSVSLTPRLPFMIFAPRKGGLPMIAFAFGHSVSVPSSFWMASRHSMVSSGRRIGLRPAS